MDSDSLDESGLAERLAGYDEALRGADVAEAHDGLSPIEPSGAFHPLLDCLIRLERRFPRPAGGGTRENGERGASRDEAKTGGTTDAIRIGRFQIEREVGRGGFGVVFRAYDPELNRHVALKVPRLDMLESPALRRRFLNEAKAAAALDHPNIIPIFEVGETGPACYIALAYCEGQDLARWMAERTEPVPPAQAAAIVAALADAVQHGHERGILHRDLKPANVMLVPSPDAHRSAAEVLSLIPRLTDFGMAKLVDAALTQTRTSVVMGTPLYMSPEQAEGATQQVGPATDVYGLGAILYELLVGKPPFHGDTLVGVLDRLRSDDEAVGPRKTRPSIPADLEAICLKCLRKDRAQRYPSAAELAADLRRFLGGQPVEARKLSRWARFWNWTKRRQRIRDAGVLMICLNAIVAGWCLVSAILILSGRLVVPGAASGGTIRDTLTVVMIHSLAAWLGGRMLREKRYAVRMGTVVSLGLFVAGLLGLAGLGDPFGGVYQDPVLRTVVFNILCAVFAVQLAACIVAVIADRAKHALLNSRVSHQ